MNYGIYTYKKVDWTEVYFCIVDVFCIINCFFKEFIGFVDILCIYEYIYKMCFCIFENCQEV